MTDVDNTTPPPPPPERRRRDWLGTARRCVLRRRARQNGVELHKIEIDPDIVMAALAIIMLLLGCAVTFTIVQQRHIKNNQNRLDGQQVQLSRLEERLRVTSYQTAYRFCSRESIDRAAIHWFLTRPMVHSIPRKLAREVHKQSLLDIKRMERKDGMPVLDCAPNVVGGPAKYLPPKKQREFVRRWRDHELAPAEIGICKINIGKITDPRNCLKG